MHPSATAGHLCMLRFVGFLLPHRCSSSTPAPFPVPRHLRWSSALASLESSLETAQREAAAYRDEAAALQTEASVGLMQGRRLLQAVACGLARPRMQQASGQRAQPDIHSCPLTSHTPTIHSWWQ